MTWTDEAVLDVLTRRCVTITRDIDEPALVVWPRKCVTVTREVMLTRDVDEPSLDVADDVDSRVTVWLDVAAS